MYRNRSPQQIIQHWQDDVEQNMEAGTSPVLELGAGDLPTDDLSALLGVQRWSSLRTDVTTPFLPAGGLGPLWLASLMRPVPRYIEASPPEAAVVYCGSNEAEYLMTVSLLHAATEGHGSTVVTPASRRTAIPISYFAPHSQPGMSVSWDSLPFLALTTPQPPERSSAAPGWRRHGGRRRIKYRR